MANGILAATIGGLVALVFWGVSDWLAARNSKKFGGIEVNLSVHITAAVVLAVVFIFSSRLVPSISQLFIIFSASALFSLGYVLFVRAVSTGKAGIVVPIINTYPFFALIAAYIFSDVVFSSLRISAMITVVFGAILVGTDKLQKGQSIKKPEKEIVLSVISAVLLGVELFLLNLVVDDLPWESVSFFSALMTLAVILTASFVKDKEQTAKAINEIHKNKVGLAAGATIALGSVGFFSGSEVSGSIIIPGVIASASILVTSVLAAIFDHEKIIFTKRIGAIFVVAGVVLLNLS